ncbi:MAG: archease [Thermoplasmatota archaeon]
MNSKPKEMGKGGEKGRHRARRRAEVRGGGREEAPLGEAFERDEDMTDGGGLEPRGDAGEEGPIESERTGAGEAGRGLRDGRLKGSGSAARYGGSPEARRIQRLLEKHREPPAPENRPAGVRPGKRFELLEHTADVGIQAYGATVAQVFENAALGMFSVVTDPDDVAPIQDFTVEAQAEDLKELLHEWLSRLLVISQLHGILFSSFRVELRRAEGGGVALRGWALGEGADPSRHIYKTEIKAVTRHMLELRENPPGARVLFDI